MNDSHLVPSHLREAIEAACKGAGVSLITLVVRGQHRQMRMEVLIDSPTGITHEHCRAVSRDIDSRLEGDEYYGAFRAVEVSSPGAETPVCFLWQLTKHVGRIVRVVVTDGTVIQGTLLEVTDQALSVQPSKASSSNQQTPITISASEISEARTVISL